MSDDKKGCWQYPRRKETMKVETENAVRNVLAIDGEIEESVIERAISILKGQLEENLPSIPYLSRKAVMEHLKCHRRTLDYYLKKGLLDRVYRVGGVKAIGVSRESFLRFQKLRVQGAAS